jgi:RNA polymerase sigma-70 factor (ECF subfamily)
MVDFPVESFSAKYDDNQPTGSTSRMRSPPFSRPFRSLPYFFGLAISVWQYAAEIDRGHGMAKRKSVDEVALLARLRTGEKSAFEELVRQHHGAMKRVASAIIGEAQAEEAVQEAWIAAIRCLADFEGRSSLKTWLFSIVINEARGRLRKAKREVLLEDYPAQQEGLYDPGRFVSDGHWAQEPPLWRDDSPEALLSHEDFLRCLEEVITMLPEIQRSVLTLREYQGLEMKQICNILSISASNIRVLLHRARTKVYAMVEQFEETGTC